MYKFLITRKIYLSKTISLPSLRYYKSLLQNGQSLRSCPLLMQQKIIFFLHIFFLMKKARTGYELFHTQTFLRIRTIYYFPLLQKEATTDHTLTIKYSRLDVDERVKYGIRSGSGQAKGKSRLSRLKSGLR